MIGLGLRDRLHDHVALDEIELYAEVLIAVADTDRPLSATEIDRVLGLTSAVPAESGQTAEPGEQALDGGDRPGSDPARRPRAAGPRGAPVPAPDRVPEPSPPEPSEQDTHPDGPTARDAGTGREDASPDHSVPLQDDPRTTSVARAVRRAVPKPSREPNPLCSSTHRIYPWPC
ncbi:hypothetical protein [Nocardiopsis oceani]